MQRLNSLTRKAECKMHALLIAMILVGQQPDNPAFVAGPAKANDAVLGQQVEQIALVGFSLALMGRPFFTERGVFSEPVSDIALGKAWLTHTFQCKKCGAIIRHFPVALRTEDVKSLGDRPSIRLCSRFAPRFRGAMAFSASAQPSARTVPLKTSRRCRSGAKSSADCASSRSVATRLTPSPVLATETCGFPARI